MKSFEALVKKNVAEVRNNLGHYDFTSIAKETGVVQRCERKLSICHFLLALLALSTGCSPTMERIAEVVRLIIRQSYSKQAVSKRIGHRIDTFLIRAVALLFGRMAADSCKKGIFTTFNRVLIQDSTTLPLPERFHNIFPGNANHTGKTFSLLKIQLISELFSSDIHHLSLSGFRRNDQAASKDILSAARKGDLVLRDLGYFVLKNFTVMIERGIFFLSKYRRETKLFSMETGKALNLCELLCKYGKLDIPVLLGKSHKVPVRLVCIPVPDAVANERRRKARATARKDKRYPPSKETLFLMGWSIFVTNVGKDIWTSDDIQHVYRLRWRIEIIFKAWKSHLKINELNLASERMLKLSIMIKLLFCALTHRVWHALQMAAPEALQVSILRTARALSNCAALFTTMILNISPGQYLAHILQSSIFYERRTDRKNFCQLLAESPYS